MKKRFVFALGLFSSSAYSGGYDVGRAGKDYKVILQPDAVTVNIDRKQMLENCDRGAVGCALLGKTAKGEVACIVYVDETDKELHLTIRHELKHCFGWAHKEMPVGIQQSLGSQQQEWINKNHRRWFPLSKEQLERLR